MSASVDGGWWTKCNFLSLVPSLIARPCVQWNSLNKSAKSAQLLQVTLYKTLFVSKRFDGSRSTASRLTAVASSSIPSTKSAGCRSVNPTPIRPSIAKKRAARDRPQSALCTWISISFYPAAVSSWNVVSTLKRIQIQSNSIDLFELRRYWLNFANICEFHLQNIWIKFQRNPWDLSRDLLDLTSKRLEQMKINTRSDEIHSPIQIQSAVIHQNFTALTRWYLLTDQLARNTFLRLLSCHRQNPTTSWRFSLFPKIFNSAALRINGRRGDVDTRAPD